MTKDEILTLISKYKDQIDRLNSIIDDDFTNLCKHLNIDSKSDIYDMLVDLMYNCQINSTWYEKTLGNILSSVSSDTQDEPL